MAGERPARGGRPQESNLAIYSAPRGVKTITCSVGLQCLKNQNPNAGVPSAANGLVA